MIARAARDYARTHRGLNTLTPRCLTYARAGCVS